MTTNELTGKIHVVLPEFLRFSPKLKGILPFELLKLYTIPSAYKRKHKDALANFCAKTSYGHFSEEQVEAFLKAANETVGVYSYSDGLIIKQLVNIILLYRQSKEEIIKELVTLTKEHCSNLLSISGIGAICAAGIIGEIGRIDNFRNADSLLAYAGLNPIVYESGKYKTENTKISKR
ncbi:MAG: transposase [Candidatus Caccosoma sp.]|nr:transposase [Candidatus Caccosoma sp.]